MTLAFGILAGLILVSAFAAMALPRPVHCALCLVLTFVALAGLYLHLGAQFVGLAQLLVYVGAIAILIVFAILLTRGAEATDRRPAASAWVPGVMTALVVFGALTVAVLSSEALKPRESPAPLAPVDAIGRGLMTDYVLPLEVIALLLTAALIGAVVIAMEERRSKP